jgi:hypothetical protein
VNATERRAQMITHLQGRTGGTFAACEAALIDTDWNVNAAFRLIHHAQPLKALFDLIADMPPDEATFAAQVLPKLLALQDRHRLTVCDVIDVALNYQQKFGGAR